MKFQQNAEGDKEVEVVEVVIMTVAVADMVVVTVNVIAIGVCLIMRISLVASPTPIAGRTGDATTHQPNARVKLLLTRMMQPGIIVWKDQILSANLMWNDGGEMEK